ncbi:transposase [Candidatus Tisiphia endosymbiont of Metellina segmentata]|uniref:transposase n=1 Tax=Candidatus Tisiphia endosymbiont of Metellina segmentata TaxID=3066274 RepID=UPI00313CFA44
MECFLEIFDKTRIEALTADREFIGKEWLAWLGDNHIAYVLRVKENGQYISNARGQMVKIQELFRPLAVGSYMSLFQRRIGKKGEICNVVGIRNKKGELAVLIHNDEIKNPAEIYAQRWEIETMFKAFKSAGFNCEATHITNDLRLDTLMQIMSIAFCLAYQTGEIIVLDKPIIIKKHGYRQNSIFRVGLDTLVTILYNISTQLARWIQLLSWIFQYPEIAK